MEKIFANLKKGIIAPCYLLYGEEEYLINETLNKILDTIIPEADRDFGLFYLDGENIDMESLTDDLRTPSLLGNKKVIVIKDTTIFTSRENLAKLIEKIRSTMDDNPDRAAKYFLTFLNNTGFSIEDLQGAGWRKITDEKWSEIVRGDTGEDREKWLPRILEICQASGLTDNSVTDKTEKLEEILKTGLPEGNCLIFTAETVDKRKKIYKIIEAAGVTKHFGEVKKEQVRAEILQKESEKLLKKYGKKMSPAALVALGRKTGFDFWRSISELEKLISFVGDSELIDKDDVDEAVGRTKEDNIFTLTNALGEKNQLAAIDSLQNLLDQGVHHLMIMTMISREIRLLLQARVLVDSGKLPKFNDSIEYGWFQSVLYPAFSKLNTASAKHEGLIFTQHPFSVYNAMRNCLYFTTAHLIDLMEELLNLELALKTSGTSNPKLLLENYLIKACTN
ncbi:MAG: DNA polymerase III subunit delta [Syntrophaceae bacterium]|nr:DNA polymerase III subunit delta [Syntrophaceae bacterium]